MTSILRLEIPDALLVESKLQGDARGTFSEIYRADILAQAGFDRPFVQENVSRSPRAGTLRGLHFQAPPHAQDKLVRVGSGAILDVIVDIRRGSPTFGRSVAVELSAENGRQLLAPQGVAHGFCTLTADCEVIYKVTNYYAPMAEAGLLWSDPALGIPWPDVVADLMINDRDNAWPMLSGLESPFKFGGQQGENL